MRNLCTLCAGLEIPKDQADRIKAGQNETHPEGGPTHVLRERFCLGKQQLRDSAGGKIAGKRCHLCLLLLRSLEHHLSDGPMDLILLFRAQEINLALQLATDERRGHPLRVSVGSGK